MVNPDLPLAVTFWAASSPPALRATLVISRLGEEQAGAGRSRQPRPGPGGKGDESVEAGAAPEMCKWPGKARTGHRE